MVTFHVTVQAIFLECDEFQLGILGASQKKSILMLFDMYFYNYYDYCTAKCLDPFDLKINVSTANISMCTILLATVNNNHSLTGLTCIILFTQQAGFTEVPTLLFMLLKKWSR